MNGSDDAAATPLRVARNTLHSALGEASNLLLFLLGFLAARLLGPEDFGRYGAAFAFVGLFRLLPDLGMSYASTLEISRDRSTASRLIGNILGFQVVLSLIAVGACVGIGTWLYEGTTRTAVYLLSLDLVIKAFKSTLRWLLKSFQRFGVESITLVIERALILVVALAVLLRGGGVVAFVLVFVLIRIPDAAAIGYWVHTRILRLRPLADLGTWTELLRKGLPFAYAGAVILAFFQIDTVMIEAIRNATEAGLYSAPVRVLEGLTLVPRILGYALIPTMAALHGTEPRRVTELYRRGTKYLLLVGLPIGVFGVLEAERFIVFLFQAEYAAGARAAAILIPAATFMFLSNFGETTLACIDRWRTIVIVSTVALFLNVALNVAWIPRYGFVGAAWTTLVTEASYFVMTAVALARFGHPVNWLAVALRPVLCAAAFGGVLYVGAGLGLLTLSITASAVWIAATFALRVWTPEEIGVARSLIAGLR